MKKNETASRVVLPYRASVVSETQLQSITTGRRQIRGYICCYLLKHNFLPLLWRNIPFTAEFKYSSFETHQCNLDDHYEDIELD